MLVVLLLTRLVVSTFEAQKTFEPMTDSLEPSRLIERDARNCNELEVEDPVPAWNIFVLQILTLSNCRRVFLGIL